MDIDLATVINVWNKAILGIDKSDISEVDNVNDLRKYLSESLRSQLDHIIETEYKELTKKSGLEEISDPVILRSTIK